MFFFTFSYERSYAGQGLFAKHLGDLKKKAERRKQDGESLLLSANCRLSTLARVKYILVFLTKTKAKHYINKCIFVG
jgi:hypothetical protein